jgi:putative tryptophan/tyrosine transport system substrate-binding protein
MQRRQFIALLGGTVAAWPLAVRAQQPAIPTIGFLRSTLPDASTDLLVALRKGLKEAGYVEGQNITIEYRWAENRHERLSALAADLVRQRCVAIIAGGVDAASAAKAATATIPIIFATGDDPVRSGLVGSLNRPGGNVTGVFGVSATVEGKQLGLLREVVPKAAVIGMLVNPASRSFERQERETQAAARALGQQLHVFKASSEHDIDSAFAALTQYQIGALLIAANSLFTGQRDQLVALAARHAMPTLHYTREFVEAGGLMSYGTSIRDQYRQVGVYVGRVLKGEKPADLPIIQSSKFDLVINLKTAKTLGLTVPFGLLNAADEVIE